MPAHSRLLSLALCSVFLVSCSSVSNMAQSTKDATVGLFKDDKRTDIDFENNTLESSIHEDTVLSALESSKTGEMIKWVDRGVNERGDVYINNTYVTGDGRNCRDIVERVWKQDKGWRQYATACRSEDGWFVHYQF